MVDLLDATQTSGIGPSLPRRRRRVAVAGAVLVTVSVAALVVGLTHGLPDRRAAVTPAASGSYWFSDVRNELTGQDTLRWISPFGDTAQSSSGTQTSPEPHTFVFGHEQLDWSQYLGLPTSVDGLRAAIATSLGLPLQPGVTAPPETDQTFQTASALLFSPVSPAIRASALQILEGVPGVTDAGATTDSTGRPGERFTRVEADGSTSTLIVALDSATALESSRTGPGPDVPATWDYVYVRTGFTSGPGVVP